MKAIAVAVHRADPFFSIGVLRPDTPIDRFPVGILVFMQTLGLKSLGEHVRSEPVGGLWNNAPQNLLTLSPGQWMEFAFHPLAQHAREVELDIDVNALIVKTDLIDYYHRIPERFEVADAIRANEDVERIEPHDKGFQVASRHVETGQERLC